MHIAIERNPTRPSRTSFQASTCVRTLKARRMTKLDSILNVNCPVLTAAVDHCVVSRLHDNLVSVGCTVVSVWVRRGLKPFVRLSVGDDKRSTSIAADRL